jgi:uncharacterized Ntn-hydrolase superfamily protein
MRIATFSIVGFDAEAREWGVGVASRFLAVGAYVPFARADAGAIATQALANLAYGAEGLALLAAGKSAAEVVRVLTEPDPGRDERQVGVVDAQGQAATYTGTACMNWAGGVTGPGYAAQGNILSGPEVVEAIGRAFESETGNLGQRLFAGLQAGDGAGGDRRGRQGAALKVVRAGGGYGGFNDVVLDLRVDDHPTPIAELGRLMSLHALYFGSTPTAEKLPLDEEIMRELQAMARQAGLYLGDIHGRLDVETTAALRAMTGIENLEERIDLLRATIDPPALDFLRARFALGDDPL